MASPTILCGDYILLKICRNAFFVFTKNKKKNLNVNYYANKCRISDSPFIVEHMAVGYIVKL